MIRNRIFEARHRRPEPRRRLVSRLGSVVVLCGLLAGTAPALAASTPNDGSQSGDASGQATTSSGLEIPDVSLRPPCDDLPGYNDFPDCEEEGGDRPPPPPQGCNASITKSVTRTSDASLVRFNGGVSCYNITLQAEVSTVLYDRTSGRDGNPLSEVVGAVGTAGTINAGDRSVSILDRNYPAGTNVEVVLQSVLTAPSGFVWNRCDPGTGLRHVRPCEGVGTNTLRAWNGTGSFPTGVQPQEECREDHTPKVSNLGGIFAAVRVTPHIKYCGYFNMGSDSRVTRVEKLRPTTIEPLIGGVVCNANFFPDPPAADGTPMSDGRFGKFEVTVRWTLGPCDGVGALAYYIKIVRNYQTNGVVQIVDRESDNPI